ncbi:OmpA-OmpF porin, OOP family [Candidatus Magnetomoraceae bacterium gMMP-15]
MKAKFFKFILVCLCFMMFITYSHSQDSKMQFPKTEAEIINAFKPLKTRGLGKHRGLDKVVKVAALINFDYNSALIRPESFALLDEYIKALSGGLAVFEFIIAGHTDSIGSNAYNQNLSEKRAASVQNYLISKGIDSKRLKIKAHGELDPIASNSDDEGRAMNRRVEFIMEK